VRGRIRGARHRPDCSGLLRPVHCRAASRPNGRFPVIRMGDLVPHGSGRRARKVWQAPFMAAVRGIRDLPGQLEWGQAVRLTGEQHRQADTTRAMREDPANRSARRRVNRVRPGFPAGFNGSARIPGGRPRRLIPVRTTADCPAAPSTRATDNREGTRPASALAGGGPGVAPEASRQS